MKDAIKIIIADDHNLFIDGLKLLLKDETDMHVVETVNDGKELLDILPPAAVDLVLLDINMPKLNGLETMKFLKQSFPNLKVIML